VTTEGPIAGSADDDHAQRFTHLRPLLFTIAYEILGSATESDDVLQDSYLRWADVDLATVRDTKSYLAQLVTSQALNALRARAAANTGDMDGLLSLLAPDATWTVDSGGKAPAGRGPVVGAKKVAAVLMAAFRFRRRTPGVWFNTVNCNNAPAVVVHRGDVLEGVFLLEIVHDKITNFYAMRNPDKLAGFAVPRTISR
jgi:ketosteroid isomerase-like protein